MVIDSKVNGGLEGHGFQGGVDGMDVLEELAEKSPRDDRSVCVFVCVRECVCGVWVCQQPDLMLTINTNHLCLLSVIFHTSHMLKHIKINTNM